MDTKVEAQASVVFANTLVQAQTYNLQMTKVITQDFDVSSLYGNYALGGDLSFSADFVSFDVRRLSQISVPYLIE